MNYRRLTLHGVDEVYLVEGSNAGYSQNFCNNHLIKPLIMLPTLQQPMIHRIKGAFHFKSLKEALQNRSHIHVGKYPMSSSRTIYTVFQKNEYANNKQTAP